MILSLLVFGFLFHTSSSRPNMQRIMINNHHWEVPDEKGWEEVIDDAKSTQEKFFNRCTSASECRRIVDVLRAVFAKYPVSRKYLETHPEDANNMLSTIFKWGWQTSAIDVLHENIHFIVQFFVFSNDWILFLLHEQEITVYLTLGIFCLFEIYFKVFCSVHSKDIHERMKETVWSVEVISSLILFLLRLEWNIVSKLARDITRRIEDDDTVPPVAILRSSSSNANFLWWSPDDLSEILGARFAFELKGVSFRLRPRFLHHFVS